MALLRYIIVYIILGTLAQPLTAQNVDINQSPNFQVLPTCAGLCLQDPATYVDVRSGIGCPADPFGQNECYCREDLKSSASSYISSCVFASCGPNTTNVANAISVSNAYCLTAIGLNGSDFSTTMSSEQASSSTAGAAQGISTSNAPLTGTNAVPSLELEPISYGPPTVPPTHSPIPAYSDSGPLLQGYCNTPDYVLLDGPNAYWAPMVGCNTDKTDCCPYTVAQQTYPGLATGITVTVVSTVTVNIGAGPTQVPYTGLNAYPVPASANEASLQNCPDDYQTVSGGCCPSGYQLWNAVLGGQVPCYSSLSDTLSPPAVPIVNYQTPMSVPTPSILTAEISSSSSIPVGTPTSAVVNIIFAAPFPLVPATTQGLSTPAKAGIGTVSGVAGIAIMALVLVLISRNKGKTHGTKSNSPSQIARPEPEAGQGKGPMASVLPNQYEQTPGSLPAQTTYFSPHQIQQAQQGLPQRNPDAQQEEVQALQHGQVRLPPAQHPSQPLYATSPPLPLGARYGDQGGYLQKGMSGSADAASSMGLQKPELQGHGYEASSVPVQRSRKPVPTSMTSSPLFLGQEYALGQSIAPGRSVGP